MKFKLISLLSSLLLTATVFAAPIQTIRFATEPTYPPFEYMDESGQIKGFDIAIANALCQELHATCTFSSQPFSSLIPSLQVGKYDALIAALGVTPARSKQVLFTDTYYEPSASFIASTSKHYLLKDIVGKKIGVQLGSTFETYLKDKYGRSITLKTYANIQEAYLDLISGRVDAVIADTPIATAWLADDNHKASYSVIDKPIIDHNYFGAGYGIAVRKDNVELATALNQALAKIKANGTYTMLIKTYFHNE